MRRKRCFLCFTKMKASVLGYCRISSLHGFRNIATENNKWHESFFWLVICLSSTIMTIIMLETVWERFKKSPTSTTIETNNYPIQNIPFPAVTICNLNQILESSAHVMAKKFEEHGVQESELYRFLKEVPQIYSSRMPGFENDQAVSKAMEDMGYDLETFMFDLSQPCSEFLIRCKWLGRDYNCSTLFDEVKTPEGFCCGFNWHGSMVPKYEDTFIRNNWDKEISLFGGLEQEVFISEAGTSQAGLIVVLDPDETNFFSAIDSFFGSVVIVHNALQYPDSDSPRAFVQPRSDTLVRIRPNAIDSTRDVRYLNIHQRQCYFDGELILESKNDYSYETCSLECKLYRYVTNCGCIPFFYPNLTGARICGLLDTKCLHDNRVLASQDTGIATADWITSTNDNHCKCLPACNDIKYDLIVQGNEIQRPEHASLLFKNNLGNRSAVSVFFEQNVCIKYRMESMLTWDSVIASFGGIFSLCLGGSIISIIELLYYFLYDFRKLTRRELRLRKIRRVLIKPGQSNPLGEFKPIFSVLPQMKKPTKK